MKTISFYSEKGGVGKSTFNILYASWLQKHGLKPAIVDFDNRDYEYRLREINARAEAIRQMPEKSEAQKKQKAAKLQALDQAANNAYPIINPPFASPKRMKRFRLTREEYYQTLLLQYTDAQGKLRDRDVIVLDFAGSMSDGKLGSLLSGGLISLIVMPLDRDQQSIIASLKTKDALMKINMPFAGFLNKVQQYDSKLMYDQLKNTFMEVGVPMLPDMISYTDRITKIDSVNILRSTIGYPDWTDKQFAGSRDIGLENLFRDVSILLDKEKDLPSTGIADLSAVTSLPKLNGEQSINRQLTATSFPQLELSLENKHKTHFIKNAKDEYGQAEEDDETKEKEETREIDEDQPEAHAEPTNDETCEDENEKNPDRQTDPNAEDAPKPTSEDDDGYEPASDPYDPDEIETA